ERLTFEKRVCQGERTGDTDRAQDKNRCVRSAGGYGFMHKKESPFPSNVSSQLHEETRGTARIGDDETAFWAAWLNDDAKSARHQLPFTNVYQQLFYRIDLALSVPNS